MQLKPVILNKQFYFTLFLVGIATFIVHELCHWITGVALGYKMFASLNQVWSQTEMTSGHKILVDAAGPIFTIIQGIVGFWWVKSRLSSTGFSMLYMSFFMRLFAGVVSIFNLNDEARISLQLGLGTWTLPIVVILFLFTLLYFASRRLRLTFRDHFFCYLTASIVVTLIVGAGNIHGG